MNNSKRLEIDEIIAFIAFIMDMMDEYIKSKEGKYRAF